MTSKRNPRAALMILMLSLQAAGAMAQETTAETSADQTRSDMQRVLRQYSPAVRRVLQLDPTLMANERYMATYPALAAFVAQHPEVVSNARYYVGDPDTGYVAESETTRLWSNMLEVMATFAGIFTAIGVLAWLVRTVIDHRRWLRLSKVQTEVHSKLLDRFSSNEELMAYIQTPAGKNFLQSAPIPVAAGPRPVSAPIGRILLSVQAGMVLAFGGVGLQYMGSRIQDRAAEPFFGLGALAIALGIGFVLSAVVSYILSRRLGLLDQQPQSPS